MDNSGQFIIYQWPVFLKYRIYKYRDTFFTNIKRVRTVVHACAPTPRLASIYITITF